jgi:hypothetical protein
MRLGIVMAGALAVTFSGCSSRPFCLNCGNEDGGTSSTLDLGAGGGGDGMNSQTDLGSGDRVIGVDDAGNCIPTSGGLEICDNVDNDCNGTVDDVAAPRLLDPNNCGTCGNVCNFNAQHQFGDCVPGTGGGPATCQPGSCQPGWVDADHNPATGCELACIPTNGGDEICDRVDNNCDGNVDEGFDLSNDEANCGGCGVSCARFHTAGFCNNGTCEVGTCEAGYRDLDNSLASGCEYQCPVFPAQLEVCDGVDNDCNGAIDDNPADVGGSCSNACGTVDPCVAAGTCSFPLSTCSDQCCGICTQGTLRCAPGGQPFCDSATGPQLERCNGLDDNCDGQIDEGFDKQTDPSNCGSCGTICNLPNTFPTCTNGSCTALLRCKPGFADANHNPADGCEATCANPKTTETCNGIDDDCDGVVDEDLTVPPNFTCVQTSICAGAQPVCCGTSGWACDYPSVNPNIEIAGLPLQCKTAGGAARNGGTLLASETKCDGQDGNCNGQSDESFLNLGKDCSAGVGECREAKQFVCSTDQRSTVCQATAHPENAKDEECNGKDDNCDGQVDETTPVAGTMCFNGSPHACLGWHDAAVQVGPIYVYQYEASRVDADDTTQGIGTTRACSKPGVLPWTSITETQAAAACTAIGARLCTEAEWQTACEGPAPPAPPRNLFSYSTAQDVYTIGVCNDDNAGLPGPRPTGPQAPVNGKTCDADWGPANGGGIYDLSGNVMEWTSTEVSVQTGSTTTIYNRLRGGAFNTPSDGTAPDGTSCEFDFNLLPSNTATSTVGFRCCSNNPF